MNDVNATTRSTSVTQDASDAAAVRRTALDYVEGWYEGNAERMERALHPDLQKRIVEKDPKTGNARLREMSASMLVGYTRDGEGTKTPKEKQQKDVTIFDICRDEASAKVVFLECRLPSSCPIRWALGHCKCPLAIQAKVA